MFFFHWELLFSFTRGWLTSGPHEQQPEQQRGEWACLLACLLRTGKRRWKRSLHQSLLCFKCAETQQGPFPFFLHLKATAASLTEGTVPAQCGRCGIRPLTNRASPLQRVGATGFWCCLYLAYGSALMRCSHFLSIFYVMVISRSPLPGPVIQSPFAKLMYCS